MTVCTKLPKNPTYGTKSCSQLRCIQFTAYIPVSIGRPCTRFASTKPKPPSKLITPKPLQNRYTPPATSNPPGNGSKTKAATPPPQPFPAAQPPSARPPQLKHGYPPRLLIYHAGTGRTVFIASTRLLGIFIFIFAAVLVAPSFVVSATEPTWFAALAVGGGAVPLLVMTFTTAPFVTYVHLALPLWARASSARLHRFAQMLPSTATLDVTTLRWIWPRVTRLQAGELYIRQGKAVRAMTLRREVPQRVLDERRWWAWRPLKKFYVAGESGGTVAERDVWQEVTASIARGWERRQAREKVVFKKT